MTPAPDRICPIMSRPVTFYSGVDACELSGVVMCQREKCEAWKPASVNGGLYCALIWRPVI